MSLNEVEKNTGWGNEDQPARFASLLKSKTGKTWYYNFAQRDGNTNGQGNLILTTYPIESSGDHQLSYSRSVARVAIIVNGIRVNVFSTHLDADSSSRRSTQMRELKSWADNFPEQRIIAGDFNAWPGASEIAIMTAGLQRRLGRRRRARTSPWPIPATPPATRATAASITSGTRRGASRLKLKTGRGCSTCATRAA